MCPKVGLVVQMDKVCEMWAIAVLLFGQSEWKTWAGAPSVGADAAPVRVRAPRPGEPTAGGTAPIWATAPLVLILVFVAVAALRAAMLLSIRVIALVRVHAGVRLVPRALRADITATALAVLLVLTVVSKQLLLGNKQQHDCCCKNHWKVMSRLFLSVLQKWLGLVD